MRPNCVTHQTKAFLAVFIQNNSESFQIRLVSSAFRGNHPVYWHGSSDRVSCVRSDWTRLPYIPLSLANLKVQIIRLIFRRLVENARTMDGQICSVLDSSYLRWCISSSGRPGLLSWGLFRLQLVWRLPDAWHWHIRSKHNLQVVVVVVGARNLGQPRHNNWRVWNNRISRWLPAGWTRDVRFFLLRPQEQIPI